MGEGRNRKRNHAVAAHNPKHESAVFSIPDGAAGIAPIAKDRLYFAVPFVVAFVSFMVFLPSLFHGFTNWDDADYITKCTYIKYVTWENIWFFLTQPYFSNYHPITSFSYMLEYRLWKLEPLGYHAVNLVLHAANAILVYAFALVLIRKPIWAGFVALLFAVHPQRVEVVAWLAARKDLLCTLFFLPSLICWVWYGRYGGRKYYWSALGFFALSVLSKPMSITLPAVILALDYLIGRKPGWNLIREKIPFILVSVLSALLTVYAQSRGGSIRTDIGFAWWIKIQTVSYGFVFYLGKFLWPSALSPLYAYGSTPSTILPRAAAYAPFVLLILGGLSVWLMRRSRWWTYGILTYAIMLLPVIQIVPIGQAYAADRYTYLPMIGLILALVFSIGKWSQGLNVVRQRQLIALAGIVLLAYGTVSWRYSRVWKDGVTLWEYAVKARPNMSTAYNNLGAEYMQRGRMEEAYAALNRAIELFPTYALAYNNRGNYYVAKGELQRALDDYQMCLMLSPASAAAHNNVGTVLGMLDREKEAVEAYSRAISINPFYAEAYINRGTALRKLGETDKAVSDLLSSVEVNPNLPIAYLELANMLHGLGKTQEAEVMFSLAFRYAPDDPEIYMARGTAYKSEGRFQEAVSDLQKAFDMGYTTEQVINNLAASLAELGEHKRAIDIYTEGLKVHPDLPPLLANRGASYLRLKRLEDARRDLDRCIAVYPKMPMAWKTRGILNSTEQKIPEAIADFTQALQLDPKFQDARVNRAANYMISKQYDKAWEDVRFMRQQGVKLNSNFIKQLQEASGIKE